MTDPEICIAAMTDWPVEARPLECHYSTRFCEWSRFSGGDMDGNGGITNDHAIALFVAAGIQYLYQHANTEAVTFTIGETSETHVQLELDHFQDPALRNRRQEGSTRHNGPTLLSAIDQAIRSIK